MCVTKSRTLVANGIWVETTKVMFTRVPACIPDRNVANYVRMWGTLISLERKMIQRNTVIRQKSKIEWEDGTRYCYVQLEEPLPRIHIVQGKEIFAQHNGQGEFRCRKKLPKKCSGVGREQSCKDEVVS